MSTGKRAGPFTRDAQTRAGGQAGRALGAGVVVGKNEGPEDLKEKGKGEMGERN